MHSFFIACFILKLIKFDLDDVGGERLMNACQIALESDLMLAKVIGVLMAHRMIGVMAVSSKAYQLWNLCMNLDVEL